MKTLEELVNLRDELKLAYDTVLNNPDTEYDQATVQYARKCYEDAEKSLKVAIMTPGYPVLDFDKINAALEKAKEKGLDPDTVILNYDDVLDDLTKESEELGLSDENF